MCTLIEKTRELLRTRPRDVSYQDLADRAQLKRDWIDHFANNKDGDFGVRKVQRLYECLSGKPLQV